MLVLENHFKGKDTTIVGNVVSNGCTVFHYKDRLAIFKEHNVDPETQESLNDAYILNQKEPENWVELSKSTTSIRLMVAKNTRCLDILINDKSISIRQIVAEQDYGLNKLIRDKAWVVRAAVAGQGHGLEKLINDSYSVVRIKVVEQGYGLDRLIKDDNWVVRKAVAKMGYGLDILIKDSNEYVKHTAMVKLAEQTSDKKSK